MKKYTKAALLSGFVFPGVGHIYLKKHIIGIVLVSTTIAVVYYLMTKIVERALQITEKIQSGAVQLDAAAITEFLSKQSASADSQLQTVATAVLFIAWLIGIVDSYRVGCVQEKIRK